jgi:hypothetical protein
VWPASTTTLVGGAARLMSSTVVGRPASAASASTSHISTLFAAATAKRVRLDGCQQKLTRDPSTSVSRSANSGTCGTSHQPNLLIMVYRLPVGGMCVRPIHISEAVVGEFCI